MSKKEMNRLEVMQRIAAGKMTQKSAGEMLGISERQVKRLWRSYREKGAEGLLSQRRGKPSNNRLSGEVIQAVVEKLYEVYSDFGPTLAHEKLTEVHGIDISVESVRKLMIAEGIWKARKSKKVRAYQMRERRARHGELVQIDGSDHKWFEERGPRSTLLVYVDDATGKLLWLQFVDHESFFAYCEATKGYIRRYGKPVAFYSDKHGIFHQNNPQTLSGDGLTQFARALQALDIQIVCANTPQAKGRVERANQTLQDRLVKELRLQGISTPEKANLFLPQFIQDYNSRFAVQPRCSQDAHRPLLPGDDLDQVLTRRETRTLSKNLTLQYHRVIYQIQTNRPSYALRKAIVTVCENAQGQITILYKNQPLQYTVFHQQERQAEIVNTKTLDHTLRTPRKPYIPPSDHPWRKGFQTPLSKKVAPQGDISTLPD